MKPRYCEDCDKTFVSPATLRRHQEAFHTETRTKYQCWNCHKVYASKETVLKHLRQAHSDTDGKFVISSTINQRYNPQILRPDTWIPRAEARLRGTGTTYQVKIRSTKEQDVSTSKTKIPEIIICPETPEYEPHTIAEMNKIYPITLEELQKELELTDSESDISTDSDSTDCLDDIQETDTTTSTSQGVYGVCGH